MDGKAPSTPLQATRLRLILSRANRALEDFDRKSIADTGLGPSDFAVLEIILHKGPTPVNTIGRKVLLTSGSITTAVDRLEKKGLVRRDASPEDRRVCLVCLTGAGQELIETAFRKHSENLERVMEELSEPEKETLAELLKKLGKHVTAEMESTAK